jgi:hypothetical protein
MYRQNAGSRATVGLKFSLLENTVGNLPEVNAPRRPGRKKAAAFPQPPWKSAFAPGRVP